VHQDCPTCRQKGPHSRSSEVRGKVREMELPMESRDRAKRGLLVGLSPKTGNVETEPQKLNSFSAI